VFFAIRVVNPSLVSSANPSGLVAGTYTEWKGVVSGNTLTNLTLQNGSDQVYTAGTNTQVFISVTAPRENSLVTWGLNFANQDGSLKTTAVQTALGLGTGALNGWNPLVAAPNTVTYNGNRSYSLVFNGTDLTGTLSPGMRLRTTRTVAAPTQSTSLNGSTQYYSKTSPAGMTFTNNFVVSAWVKLNSYNTTVGTVIAGRYNGTSGWAFFINPSGQVTIQGMNGGSGNTATSTSYQSIPLNKWVHVAAQLDMTTTSTGGTNNYIMIDGVEVPNSFVRAGTNPTALVQAGNLEIGSYNTGVSPFNGKIAQVAIYSAKVTEANIAATISQGLAGTETSLISAYSFNNSINDLNANANNLTPNGSAVATNPDSPFGGQAGGAISSTLDYGIVTSATFSTNTTLVVQVPEGCTIPTSGGVSAVSYSSVKVPYGFPGQKTKWQVLYVNRVLGQQSSASLSTWYNLGSAQVTVPIGEWSVTWNGEIGAGAGTTGNLSARGTLSNANNTESDTTFSAACDAQAVTQLIVSVGRTSNLSLAAQTVYYLNTSVVAGTGTLTAYNNNGDSPLIIVAEQAHL
jgi:hypothetical protein